MKSHLKWHVIKKILTTTIHIHQSDNVMKEKSSVVMMIGTYGWQICDDVPCLISTINPASYWVIRLQLIIRHIIRKIV